MNTDIFEEIKNKIDIADVAEFYGLELDKRNKCVCTFHHEKTASFQVYPKSQSFYCFGCGVGGDTIAFVQKFLNLPSPIKAAERLNNDFNLGLNLKPHKPTAAERQEQAVRNQRKTISEMWEEWKDSAVKNVIKYIKLLEYWQNQYEPKSINAEYHPLFVESCQEIGFTEYLFNCMIQADEKQWQELYKTSKREINYIVERIKIYEQCNR